jgi:hypothetical protein
VDDTWVCDSCKSINRARERRCYKCHGERDEASAGTGSQQRTVEAVVSRSVRDYLPTWPLAILAGTLLVAVSVMGVLLLLRSAADFPALRDAFVAAIYSGSQGMEPGLFATQSAETAFLGLLRFGVVFLALVSFAAWLAIATMNVPTLGGGTPTRGPLRVFIYTLIPLWNLFKVPGMVQDVLYRLDATAGGAWMVMAATIGLLGSWFVSFFGSWVITAAAVGEMLQASTREQMAGVFAGIMDQSFWLSVVTESMTAVGTLLLVVLMVRVEQRCAARNRDIQGVLAELAAGPGAVPGAAPTTAVVAPPIPATPGASTEPVTPAASAPMAPHGFMVAGRSPSEAGAPPPAPPPPPPPGEPPA